MKKIFFLIISVLSFQTLSLADNIRYFQIEGMKIGDSALDYFNKSQLEDNEQGWHNYSYKEYSTSFVRGKGIYNWFLVSYKNDDNSFTIEALAAGLATRITTRTEFLGHLEYITDNLKSLSPSSLKLIKEAVKTGTSLPFTAALNFEGDLSVLLQSTEDRAEGLRAFFQKRRAKFTGD